MLTAVVVYIYSVLAFNFFRKFYIQEGEEGDGPQLKCNDLLTVSYEESFYQISLIDRISVYYLTIIIYTLDYSHCRI